MALAVAVALAVDTAGAASAAADLPTAQGSSTTPRDMEIVPASAIASRSENLAGHECINFLVVMNGFRQPDVRQLRHGLGCRGGSGSGTEASTRIVRDTPG